MRLQGRYGPGGGPVNPRVERGVLVPAAGGLVAIHPLEREAQPAPPERLPAVRHDLRDHRVARPPAALDPGTRALVVVHDPQGRALGCREYDMQQRRDLGQRVAQVRQVQIVGRSSYSELPEYDWPETTCDPTRRARV
jgi:hypothetical protein